MDFSSRVILDKPNKSTQKIIIVDGLIGGGKGLLSPIISSLPGVEMWIHRPEHEQLCGLFQLGQISLNGAKTLLRYSADYDIYNLMLGRETNFRPSDVTGMFKSTRPWEYVKRAFRKDGDTIIERIKNEKPIINIMTHAISGCSQPFFEAFDDRLVFVRITRSPTTLYVLKHIAKWSLNWGKSPRAGMLTHQIEKGGGEKIVPHAMLGQEEKYLQSESVDRAVMLLKEWQISADENLDMQKSESKSTIIEIPYEKFVFSPDQYVNQVAEAIGSKIDSTTRKMMAKQKVPRKTLTDAPESNIYRRQGWIPPSNKKSLDEEFKEGLDFVKRNGTLESVKVIEDIHQRYVDRYL